MKPIKLSRQEKLSLPSALRALLDAELAAGNRIVSTHSSFPASPMGECYQLARPITTRPHSSEGLVKFHQINSSLGAGQFSDPEGNFFILEPAGPPPPIPDMDAIRDAANTPRPKVKPEMTAEHPYLIELDYKGEGLTYQEPDRKTDIRCAFGRKVVLLPQTLSDWWYPHAKRKLPLTAEERKLVIERLVDCCFHEQNAAQVALEDWPEPGQTVSMQRPQ